MADDGYFSLLVDKWAHFMVRTLSLGVLIDVVGGIRIGGIVNKYL